jgi:hypothetical protein
MFRGETVNPISTLNRKEQYNIKADSTCSISCLYLDANGLYVNIPKYNFSLPTNITQLSQFIESLQYLLTLRREILSLADKVQTELSKPPSIIKSLGRLNDLLTFNPKTFWQRDTYYPPPTDIKSVVPKHLFGFPPVDSILEKLNTLSHKNIDASDISNNVEADVNSEGTDAFGWRQEGSKWYNVYTKTYTTTSPYGSNDSD